jgi:hypothetical protein
VIIMQENSESRFLNKARTGFMDTVDRLDAQTLTSLREARAHATKSVTDRQPLWRARPWTLPTGAIAIGLVAIACGIFWWNQSPQPTVPFATGNNGEDMAIVLGSDNLDMYADMDFYRWLQAQQQSAPQDNSGGNNSG